MAGTGGDVDGSWALSGVRVVELSSGIAGAYSTKILADAGADVIKVEDAAGDPLRNWSASGATIAAGDDGAMFRYLAASKRSVCIDGRNQGDLDLLEGLLDRADIVIWSPGSSLADVDSLRPDALRARRPQQVITSITPYGLSGPWADRAASDLTLQAAAGGVWARGSADRPPVYVGGRQDQWASAIAATTATLFALHGQQRTGTGALVDVSALEALCQWLFGYAPITHVDIAGDPMRKVRSVHIPGVERAKDGWVGLMVGTAQQWMDFCAMVEHPEWTDDPSLLRVDTRSDSGSGIAPAITDWTKDRTVDEIRDLASAFLIPNAPLANGETMPHLDHFVARRSFVRNPSGGFPQPDVPFRIHGVDPRPFGPAPSLGQHTAELRAEASVPVTAAERPKPGSATLPLEGLRVLDLTSLFAGPFVTRLLAMFGAEVIHLESVTRPDLYRMYSTRQVGVDDGWAEWTPGFSACNTNKRDLTLNLQTERGRELLLELVATCDVVVENYSSRVMDNLRLDYETLKAQRPDLVMVRMPGFGLDGPWRDIPVFAPIIEDASGITWLTGYPDEKPQEAQSVCDPNAALHALAATLIALHRRRRTGEGALVEAPMVGAAINIGAEQVVEFGAYGNLLNRDGNRGPLAAPQGLYRTSDVTDLDQGDCYVAIAIETDAQWSALVLALGAPTWAADPSLSSSKGRRAAHDLLDEHIGRWCSTQSAADIVAALAPTVPVAHVVPPHAHADNDQLRARGFYEEVDHPVMGVARYDTFPARFEPSIGAYNRSAGPLLGQDNVALLTELGCTPEEMSVLEANGVIGTEPLMGWRSRTS